MQNLIKSIGFFYKFNKKYDEYRNITSITDIQGNICNIDELPVDILDAEVFDINLSTPTASNDSVESESAIIGLSSNSSDIDERETKSKTSLNHLLINSSRGTEIYQSYHKNKIFNRSLLCEIIINHELKNNADNRITSSRFEYWANEIVKIFSTERKEIYYIPYQRDHLGQPVSAKGKLWDKYCNKRRLYRKIGLLVKTGSSSVTVPTETNIREEDPIRDEHYEWLKNNIQPWPTVAEYWHSTCNKRLQQQTSSILEYFKTFPCLKQPLGYELLEIDFELHFADYKNKFYYVWPEYAKRIIIFAENSSDKYVKSYLSSINYKNSEEEVNITALLILPLLLPIHTPKRKSDCNTWRPSKIEVQEGFVLHIQNIAELESKLQARQEKLSRFKLTDQPLPVIVGKVDNVHAAYVIVDGHRYKVQTPMKAIDLCYKIFHVLSAKYPYECEHVWTFIQKIIFQMNTKYDRHFTSVEILTSNLKSISV